MLQYLKSFANFLHRKCKAFIHGASNSNCVTNRQRRKRSFDALISSFTPTNQFKTVFNLIDANGDDKISAHELSKILSSLGYDKSNAEREAQSMVKEMDCNGDGFIDFHEFFDAVNVGSDGYNDCGEEVDLMDAFLIFDVDKNGLISDAKLQKVLANLGCHNCSLQQCRRMIESVDKDGDGFVDFNEFRRMMKPNSK